MGVLLGVTVPQQEIMEQMGYDLRIGNPVCPYLNLDMQNNQVMFGVNELN